MVFPLRLSPFECYMMLDDRARHPMAFTIKLLFSGNFDETAFRTAADNAVARHPLLRARIAGESYRDWHWVAAENPAPPIDVADHGQPRQFPEGRAQIDLTRENGVRIWVRTDGDEVDMRIQFHHACCDGIGAYRFIEDVLAGYDQQLAGGGPAGQQRPVEESRLAKRTTLGMTRLQSWLRLPNDLWGIIVGMAIFFINRPTDLPSPAEPRLSEAEEQTVLEMPSHAFTPEQYQALREVAREANATVNDLLMRDMLLGMHRWIRQVDDRLKKRYLRLMVPVNLRGPDDDVMPAANVVGMAFIDRKPLRYASSRRLLRGIQLETKWFKFFRFATAFPRCCSLLMKVLPGGPKILADSSRCFTTSAMSNMGRILYGHTLRTEQGEIVVGDLVLKSVESAPPVRPFSSTSLTALSYAGKLIVTMNYDRYHFTRADAEALFAMMVEQLEESSRSAAGKLEQTSPTA